MKNDVNVPSKSKKLKGKNLFFGGILKTTDEKSRIQIQIRIFNSVVEIKIVDSRYRYLMTWHHRRSPA
jgi:hypothetical protein